MDRDKTHSKKGGAVGSEFVCDNPSRLEAVALQEFLHQLQCDLRISLPLDLEVEDLAFVVDSSPEPVALPSDGDSHLIQMPVITWPWAVSPEVSGDGRAEFQEPTTHRLI